MIQKKSHTEKQFANITPKTNRNKITFGINRKSKAGKEGCVKIISA